MKERVRQIENLFSYLRAREFQKTGGLMKRILVLILVFAFVNAAYSAGLTSGHGFSAAVTSDEIPDPAADPSDDDVSSGAIVGIAVGSAAGVALLGGLAWLYFAYKARGLAGGAVCDYFISPICIDDSTLSKLKADASKNVYLAKALEVNGIRPCPGSRYVIVEDNYVENKTFNMVCFKIPSEMMNANGALNVRVTQVSEGFEGKEFEGRIFINNNSGKRTLFDSEVKLRPVISQETGGIVQKTGTITQRQLRTDDAVLIVSYDKKGAADAMRYAYVIEFTR